jgi:GntR family transcriptional regulator
VRIDYDAAEPPYLQLVAILRDRIESGQYAPGARMPSLTYLVQEFGIAKNTARRAVQILADEGLVVTRQGWGSFVKAPE